MSLDARKPVFSISDKVRLRQEIHASKIHLLTHFLSYMGLKARKHVFRISDQVRLRQAISTSKINLLTHFLSNMDLDVKKYVFEVSNQVWHRQAIGTSLIHLLIPASNLIWASTRGNLSSGSELDLPSNPLPMLYGPRREKTRLQGTS